MLQSLNLGVVMKVLVVGSGGREHALTYALSLSPSVTEIHAIPGSDGMGRHTLCHKLDWHDHESIIIFCLRTEIDFVIIGPEDPLCDGLADSLRQRGILVVGPGHDGARLEGSKKFAKEFMIEAKIPTAKHKIVRTVEETLSVATNFLPPFVFKADGLAAGKGVFICKTESELKLAAQSLFEEKSLGKAGETALLEQFTQGWELSYLIFTNGTDFESLPIAQDHKRLLNNDEGPNTGGMGTVAPLKISKNLKISIDELIVKPTLLQLQKNGIFYRGIIFFGLMITKNGPSLLEYNCRLGDPETQVILPLIDGDLGIILKDLAQGKIRPLKYKSLTATCVVLAAPNYPLAPEKGVTIEGNIYHESPASYFIHSGTAKNINGKWTTNGGRVLCAVGVGSNLQESIKAAYLQAANVKWTRVQMRTDIGSKITSLN